LNINQINWENIHQILQVICRRCLELSDLYPNDPILRDGTAVIPLSMHYSNELKMFRDGIKDPVRNLHHPELDLKFGIIHGACSLPNVITSFNRKSFSQEKLQLSPISTIFR